MLHGFVRLRFNDSEFTKRLSIFDNSVALIRELHVYGSLVKVNSANDTDVSQHTGIGKRLLEEAERIARDAGYQSVAVISGVGVRNYYRKRGYEDSDYGYLVKNLSQTSQTTTPNTPNTANTATTHTQLSAERGLSEPERRKFFALFRNVFLIAFSLLVLLFLYLK